MKRWITLLTACLLLCSCAGNAGNTATSGGDESTSEASEIEQSRPEEVPTMRVAGKSHEGVTLNPQGDIDGIAIYDKDSGRTVIEGREGYTDLLIFENVVADIRKNKSGFTPFPNGYLIRMPDEEAASVAIGDGVSLFGMAVNTNPLEYVYLRDLVKIPIYFRNETRTAVARAVLYDNDYIHDSTDTNIYGREIVVDASGTVIKTTTSGVEGFSGNASIPEGGFVLSSAYSGYTSMFSVIREGDKAQLIKEYGMYDFYVINDMMSGYGQKGEEYLTRVTEGTTRKDPLFLEYVVDKDGVVISSSTGGGTEVPEGGMVLVATGVKYNELKRFCHIGDRVFVRSGKLYILTDAEQNIRLMQEQLSALKATEASAKEKLLTMEYAAIDASIAEAEALLEAGDYEKLADKLATLQTVITPNFAVQERGAWVTDYDRDQADIEKTVAYAASIGLNTLYISPYRDSYALYPSKVPHMSQHPEVDFDVFQAYIDACRKHNITIIFDICTFVTQLPDKTKYSANHYVNFFGDKLLLSKKGRNVAYFYDTPSYTLDPYDPEIRAFYIAVIKEIVDKYDIDGVQLDYIRFPLPSYFGANNYEDFGYNEKTMEDFMKKMKTQSKPNTYSIDDKLWEPWCAFRRDIITSFIKELKTAIGDTSLTCTCFADYNDRQKYVFQDVEQWTDYIDAIYPMIYSATLEGQVKYGDEMYDLIGDSTRIVLGIGTYDGETDEIVSQQVEYASAFADGNAIFALNYTQHFGFDVTYKRLFAQFPAIRSDQEGKTAEAFLDWMALTTTQVYAYLYDCDLSEVEAALKASADRLAELTGKELLNAFATEKKALLALSDALPEETRQDYADKLALLEKFLKR